MHTGADIYEPSTTDTVSEEGGREGGREREGGRNERRVEVDKEEWSYGGKRLKEGGWRRNEGGREEREGGRIDGRRGEGGKAGWRERVRMV